MFALKTQDKNNVVFFHQVARFEAKYDNETNTDYLLAHTNTGVVQLGSWKGEGEAEYELKHILREAAEMMRLEIHEVPKPGFVLFG